MGVLRCAVVEGTHCWPGCCEVWHFAQQLRWWGALRWGALRCDGLAGLPRW